MTKRNKKHSINDYKLLARKFKTAGLINVDLRKKDLSTYQKRKLRELEKDTHKMAVANSLYTKKTKKTEYENLIIAKKTGNKKEVRQAEKEYFRGHKHGLTDFKIRTLRDKTKLQEFKDNGYLVVKNKVYIKVPYGSDARIKKMASPLSGKKVTVIEEISPGGKKAHRYIEKSINILNELENLKGVDLPPNMKIMVAVGENNPIGNSQSMEYADLMKYIELWAPKDNGSDKGALINEMSVVYMPLDMYSK